MLAPFKPFITAVLSTVFIFFLVALLRVIVVEYAGEDNIRIFFAVIGGIFIAIALFIGLKALIKKIFPP